MKPRAFEPHQIVGVNSPLGYNYRGEIISRPTPEGTIMVRRVPNHPGTVEECKITDLYQVGKYRYVHYASVEGTFSFPIDMLRYDRAAPVNFTFIDNDNGRNPLVDPSFGLPGLWIATTSSLRKPNWTHARWTSFGWRVKHEKTEDLKTAARSA